MFHRLNESFASAPILSLPDLCEQFIVEVDVSDLGIRVVLSQWITAPHLCLPFLETERNFDVGNRELLVVKVASEECCHWLEGVEHPFSVRTDHKNLEYIWTAEQLSARQARWALFNFSLSYRPVTKNIKPDALSHLFDPHSAPKSPTSIQPSSCLVGAVSWGIEER